MPKAFPLEFRRDVVAVARKGESSLRQIAKDFGISESCLHRWLAEADIDDGVRPGLTSAESAELRELKKRNRTLEQENEILRRAGGVLCSRDAPKMRYPLVRDLAAEGIPVAVTCRVLGFSKQAFYKWHRDPVSRAEMETNYFGSMRVACAFAPMLRDNGGGALVNVLSVLSFISMPQGATYSASKSAAWSLTNALRIELRRQGTLVVAVHAGFIDTDMAAGVSGEKVSPESVAKQIVTAVGSDAEEVLADATSEMVKAALPNDLTALYPALQAQWDTEMVEQP